MKDLLVLDGSATDNPSTFNIESDRADVLIEATKRAYKEKQTTDAMLNQALEGVELPNEQGFVCFVLGRVFEMGQSGPDALLARLLLAEQ